MLRANSVTAVSLLLAAIVPATGFAQAEATSLSVEPVREAAVSSSEAHTVEIQELLTEEERRQLLDAAAEELREAGIEVTYDENAEYDWDTAEEFDVDWDEYTLDRVVFVDPPQNFSRFDLERARAPEVIETNAAIERGARTLDEAVGALTPFQPLPTTGSSPGPLLVDGLDGAWVQILIDGIPFTRTTTTRSGPIPDLAAVRVDPTRIERIEIYRGGGPAGTCGASGMVLNLITKAPTRQVSGTVTLDGGVTQGGVSRFGTHGEITIPVTDDWTLRASGGFQRTQEVEVTGDETFDRPRRNLSDAELQALWRPNGEDRLTLNARTYQSLSRTIGNPRAELEDRTRARNYALDVLYRNSSENENQFMLRTSVQYLDHQFYKHVRRSGYNRIKGVTDAVTMRATGTWSREFGDHNVGVEVCTTGDIISRSGESGSTPTIREGQFCVGVDDTWRISDAFTLEARLLGGYHTDLGARWNAGLAGIARLNPAHGLRLSFDAAQRLPTVEERYLQFDHTELGYFLTGNEDLTTERAFSLRAGWVYDIIPNMLGLEITSFFTALDNRIEGIVAQAQNPPSVPVAIFSYENRGRGNSFGIDTVLRGNKINDWFGFDLTYNFLPIARDPDRNQDLHMRNHHSARLTLRGSFLSDRMNVWTSAGVRSRILWSDNDPSGPPDHATMIWDVGINGTPHELVWLGLTARNLTNYVDPNWGPMPGFEVMFTAQFHFEGRNR